MSQLLNQNFIFANEVKPKTPIKMVKRLKQGKERITMRIPDTALATGGIAGGIPEKYERSTTSTAHRKYIATMYSMCMREVAIKDGCDPAGAWS